MGGNSKVLMFVNVSPALYNMGETLCSLTFAARCRATELGQAKKQSLSGGSNSSSDNGGGQLVVPTTTNKPPLLSAAPHKISRPPSSMKKA